MGVKENQTQHLNELGKPGKGFAKQQLKERYNFVNSNFCIKAKDENYEEARKTRYEYNWIKAGNDEESSCPER